MIIDSSNRLFFLDAGPRNGGNMLPEFIGMISGADIVEATLRNAVGEDMTASISFDGKSGGYYGLVVLHTDREGYFKDVHYSEAAREDIVREEIQKKIEDEIKPFSVCNNLVGLTFMKFNSKESMDEVMYHMRNNICVL